MTDEAPVETPKPLLAEGLGSPLDGTVPSAEVPSSSPSDDAPRSPSSCGTAPASPPSQRQNQPQDNCPRADTIGLPILESGSDSPNTLPATSPPPPSQLPSPGSRRGFVLDSNELFNRYASLVGRGEVPSLRDLQLWTEQAFAVADPAAPALEQVEEDEERGGGGGGGSGGGDGKKGARGGEEQRLRDQRRSKYEAFNRELEVAAQVAALFKQWAKDDLMGQLDGLKRQLGYPSGSVEKKVLMMRDWVKANLRLRYRVYIQLYSDGAAGTDARGGSGAGPSLGPRATNTKAKGKAAAQPVPGGACKHPACGNPFRSGQHRVSFEPSVWSQPAVRDGGDGNDDGGVPTRVKAAQKESVELFLDPDFEPPRWDVSSLRLPNYASLSDPANVAKYGEGGMFCVLCFEGLLEPEPPATSPPPVSTSIPALPQLPEPQQPSRAKKSKKQKGLARGGSGGGGGGGRGNDAIEPRWIRPSPLRRIYTSVYAETRHHPRGDFVLDHGSAQLVEEWKDYLFASAVRRMRETYSFLESATSPSPPSSPFGGQQGQEEEGGDDAAIVQQDGIGLAELLWKFHA